MDKKYNGYDFVENCLKKCTPYRFSGSTEEDFYKWKDEMQEIMAELLGLYRMEKSEGDEQLISKADKQGYTLEKYHMDTLKDLKMPYYVLTPQNANGKAVIALHGHGCNGKEGLIDAENADKENMEKYNYTYVYDLLDKGYAVYVPDLLPAGERMFGIYEDNRAECTDVNNALISMGMCLQGIYITEMSMLIDKIKDNYSSIGCCGFSGGAHCALWLCAMEDRLSFGLLSGYFHSFKDTLIYSNRCGCNFIPRLWEFADMGDILAIAAPMDIYLETGRDDELNGIRGIQSPIEQLEIANRAYSVFGKKLKLEICEGMHKWYGKILGNI